MSEWLQFSSVLSHVQLFATPWTTARQASLSLETVRFLKVVQTLERYPELNPMSLFKKERKGVLSCTIEGRKGGADRGPQKGSSSGKQKEHSGCQLQKHKPGADSRTDPEGPNLPGWVQTLLSGHQEANEAFLQHPKSGLSKQKQWEELWINQQTRSNKRKTRTAPSPFRVLGLLAGERLDLKIRNRRPPKTGSWLLRQSFPPPLIPEGHRGLTRLPETSDIEHRPPASGWTDLSIEMQAREERQKSRERTFVGRGAPPFRADTCCCREGRKEQEGAAHPDKKEAQPLIPRGPRCRRRGCWHPATAWLGPAAHRQSVNCGTPVDSCRSPRMARRWEDRPAAAGEARCRKLTPRPWEAAKKPLPRNRRWVDETLGLPCTHLESLPGDKKTWLQA